MKKLCTKYIEIVNDIDTPVSVFDKVSKKYSDSFLFESVLRAEQVGRYSFIGFNALKNISSQRILEELRKEISNLEDDSEEELPFFYKGFVGFFPFETFCEIEPSVKPKNLEKAFLYLVGNLIVFDHVKQKLYLIQNSLEEDFESNLEDIMRLINENQSVARLDFDANAGINHDFEETGFYSNTGEEEFRQLIEKTKKHIYEGDVFQMVLSHKFIKDFNEKIDPFLLYRILRTVNPSPYQFLFNYEDDGEIKTLVGSSPEMMVKSIKDSSGKIKAQISPIAGTYRRTHDEKKDAELKKKLLSDEKELAEHVMLIDLARNDLSRVCDDIQVPEKIFVETYSHVMHIVSNVTGILKPMSKADSVVDLAKAAFPAGTLSGAPKVEAIKLILELEKESRGYYGGTIGYFGLNGTLDTAIMIRTMLITKNQLCIQAGCGVVADSDPESEWQETFNKANALIDVVLLAEKISGPLKFN
jgi:anthranilate synthase component I